MQTGILTGLRSFGVAPLAALLFFWGTPAKAAADFIDGWIEKVSDGDTVWVQTEPLDAYLARELGGLGASLGRAESFVDEGKETRLKVRMIGMDAPETQLPTPSSGIVSQGHWGKEASAFLERQTPVGTKITLEDHGLDTYKRTLGRILKNGKDINLSLVTAGHAVTYIICSGKECNSTFFKEQKVNAYVEECRKAQRAGKGIWDTEDPLPEMPFEFRLRMQERDPEKWVGNYATRELVEPEDYKKVPVCERIFFMKKEEATKLGFRARR